MIGMLLVWSSYRPGVNTSASCPSLMKTAACPSRTVSLAPYLIALSRRSNRHTMVSRVSSSHEMTSMNSPLRNPNTMLLALFSGDRDGRSCLGQLFIARRTAWCGLPRRLGQQHERPRLRPACPMPNFFEGISRFRGLIPFDQKAPIHRWSFLALDVTSRKHILRKKVKICGCDQDGHPLTLPAGHPTCQRLHYRPRLGLGHAGAQRWVVQDAQHQLVLPGQQRELFVVIEDRGAGGVAVIRQS